MELEQLKTYLRGAIDLESAIVAGQFALYDIDVQIERVQCQRVEIPDSQLPAMPVLHLSENEPEEPKFRKATLLETALMPTRWHLGISVYFSFCGVVLAGKWGFWGGLVGIILCFVIVDLILSIPFTMKKNSERKYSHQRAMEEHRKILKYRSDTKERHKIQVAAWEKKSEAHNLLVSSYRLLQKQQQETCEQLQQRRSQIKTRVNELRDNLFKYYSRGIIRSSYRNLVAVTQIYEYLASGIASELEGPNGAYAQYMNDVRAERICNDLEVIRSNVSYSRICSLTNQQVLYSEIRFMNPILLEVARSSKNFRSGVVDAIHQLKKLVTAAELKDS